MLLFTPLAISLLAVIYSIYWSQRFLFKKVENIEIAALSNKVQEASFTYLFRLYKAIAVVGLLVLVLIFSLPSLTLNTALGFIFGIASAGIAGYTGLLFLLKLNSKTTDSSYKGLIESFHSVLYGSNILSIFILGFSLFIISIYFISFNPTAKDLTALAIGACIVMTFSRIGVGTYTRTAFGESKILETKTNRKKQKESRDPEVVATLVGHSIEAGLSLSTTIFGIFTISTVAAMLIAPSLLGSAITIIPLLIGGVGILASFIGAKLAWLGATTNILKNTIMFVGSAILISSLFAFPVLAWFMGDSSQYSSTALWFLCVMGFLSSGVVFIYYYFIKWRDIETAKAISIFALLISILLALSFALGGIYGIALFGVSFISMAASIVTLLIFSSATTNAHNFSKITELPEERINTIDKLNSVSNIFKTGVDIYLWFSALLVSIILFFIYKQEITSRETYLDFALDNPVIVASLFLGAGLIYWITYFVLYSPQKTRRKVIDFVAKQFVEIRGKSGRAINPDHRTFVDTIAASTYKEILSLFIVIFLSRIVVSLIFGAESLGGFLIGVILLGSFMAMQMTFGEDKKEQDLAKPTSKPLKTLDKLLDIEKSASVTSINSPSLIVHIAIVSMTIASIFLVIFLIQ